MLKIIIVIFTIGFVAAVMILSYLFANYILDDDEKDKEIKEK